MRRGNIPDHVVRRTQKKTDDFLTRPDTGDKSGPKPRRNAAEKVL